MPPLWPHLFLVTCWDGKKSKMNIELEISQSIIKAFKELFDVDINRDELQLQPTRKEFEGTYTFVCFPFLRHSKKSPEQTGSLIGEYLMNNSTTVSDFNTVKGFLNISVSETQF